MKKIGVPLGPRLQAAIDAVRGSASFNDYAYGVIYDWNRQGCPRATANDFLGDKPKKVCSIYLGDTLYAALERERGRENRSQFLRRLLAETVAGQPGISEEAIE